MFEGCLPLCHWARLQCFVLSQRCAAHTELISVCTRDLTVLYSPHICGQALLHMHCEPFVARKHQLCHACAENLLAVPWMPGLHGWFVFSILPTPCSVFLCCKASNAELALPLPPKLGSMFPENYRLSWAVWHRNWWVNDWSCGFTQKVCVLPKHLELSGMVKRTVCFENAERYVLWYVQYLGKEPNISRFFSPHF